MKNIVCILGLYYPNPSPNGYCVKKIIYELKKKYNVTVISQNMENTQSFLNIDGVDVYFLTNWRSLLRNFSTFRYSHSENLINKILFKTMLTITRIIRGLLAVYKWPTSERWFIKKALNKLNELNEKKEIDILITISLPYEAHICGLEFKKKNKNVKWLTYTLDQFANSKTIYKFVIDKKARRQRNIISENEVYSNADMNIIMKCRETWFTSLSKSLEDKYESVSFPLLDPFPIQSKDVFQKDADKIHLLYSGAFYRQIRNPEYLLNLFTLINSERLVLHLFTRGDCDDIIDKYIKVSNGRIIKYNPVSIEDIHNAMQQADILINVGNTVEDTIPSKIYEYISSGKPIVNLFSHNLSYNDIFQQYPLYLALPQDMSQIAQNKELLLDFCIKNKGIVIDYKEVERLYLDSTPEYVAKIFEKYFI